MHCAELQQNQLTHIHSTEIHATSVGSALEKLASVLHERGGSLADSCIRTWVYLRDIQRDYRKMVSDRRRVFLKYGLNDYTHYIASTGIQCSDVYLKDDIRLDAYSIIGLEPDQVCYLNDFNRLCAAKNYGVTFERGVRIAYQDKYGYFISGTASIDRYGNSLYAGDVLKQLDRTLENIDALLHSGGASISDVRSMVVYLRNISDFVCVRERLALRFPMVKIKMVQGVVCRSEWLVEIEGTAVKQKESYGLPNFSIS